MEPVIPKLKRTRLFAQLPDEAIADLIAVPGVESAAAGEVVITEPGDLVVLLEGGLSMTSHDETGEHVAQFSIDEDTHDPVILYTIPAGARLVLTQPSVYVLIDGERLDGMLAGKQEVKSIGRARRGRARAYRQPDERAALQAHAVRAPGALRRGHAGNRGGATARRWSARAARATIFYVIKSGLGRCLARRYQPGGGQGCHARPRRQLRRGGAAQGRAAQRHGAHDRRRDASSSSARTTSTSCSRASCCTRSRRTRPAAMSISAARRSSIAATRRNGSCGG